ncbi:ABC transporter ATP-binding protein [uncultured Tessaracoccus sp.]|uniref:ABC transporter ATP-binding protein n=1 Tax=uncultured Tessaracoccus sp. TaxID=905023 RepID=UPI002603CE2C|nr:ABC transporter ATP-binding protein [uncultured Tessaracoccus sp.]
MNLVVKSLRDVRGVLDAVSFAVCDGEVLAIVGPSGCGKTTLLRSIAGLHAMRSGEIEIDGTSIATIPARKRNTGMVTQSASLFSGLSVQENIEFGLDGAEMDALRRRDLVDIAMATMNVSRLAQRQPESLSGGQAQRVSLARTLVRNPRVLLLDEPLAHVEATMRASIRKSLLTHVRREGAATLYVTHDIDEACAVGDSLLVLRHGTVAQLGTPREVYQRPVSQFVARFMGIPNIFAGTVVSSAQEGVIIEVGRSRMAIPGEVMPGPAALVLHPGDIRLRGAKGSEVTGLRGQVIASRFARTHTVVELETEMGTLVVHEPGDSIRQVGDVVQFELLHGWVIPA